MRLSILGLVVVGLLALPSAAAPPVSPVEVVNEPLQVTGTVEVTNEPVEVTGTVAVGNEPLSVELANPSVRWQLVGFTATTSTGDLGGPFGAVMICQAEVHPGSRMCTQVEVARTTSVPAPLPSDPLFSAWAWPDDDTGSVSGLNSFCGAWTSSSPNGRGSTVKGVGAPNDPTPCDLSRPVACCSLVP